MRYFEELSEKEQSKFIQKNRTSIYNWIKDLEPEFQKKEEELKKRIKELLTKYHFEDNITNLSLTNKLMWAEGARAHTLKYKLDNQSKKLLGTLKGWKKEELMPEQVISITFEKDKQKKDTKGYSVTTQLNCSGGNIVTSKVKAMLENVDEDMLSEKTKNNITQVRIESLFEEDWSKIKKVLNEAMDEMYEKNEELTKLAEKVSQKLKLMLKTHYDLFYGEENIKRFLKEKNIMTK